MMGNMFEPGTNQRPVFLLSIFDFDSVWTVLLIKNRKALDVFQIMFLDNISSSQYKYTASQYPALPL